MKKLIALLLAAFLLLPLCACAFGQDAMTADTVAFYRTGSNRAEIVSKQALQNQALLCYSKSQEAYFTELEPDMERLREFYPYLEYALRNGYSSFTFAADPGLDELIDDNAGLDYLYPTDGFVIRASAATINDADSEQGRLPAVCVRIEDEQKYLDRFAEGFAAVQALVDSVPEGYDEYETARYLYEYLTDNVEYDYGNYYASDWSLLYDTMIGHKTVCAGFAEALYYLYNLAGIDCQLVYGEVNDALTGDETISHAWNIATLGEYSYYFDATWDVVRVYTVADAFFAISESAMAANSDRTLEFWQDPPNAPQNFGVPDWWNDTPEGAIKSFLLLREYAAYPNMLPYLLGLYDSSTEQVKILSGGYNVYNISYDAFVARVSDYVSVACLQKQFLQGKFVEEDGMLACKAKPSFDPVYRFVRLLDQADGSYHAELSRADESYTAIFTLREQNGRWIVDGFRVQ